MPSNPRLAPQVSKAQARLSRRAKDLPIALTELRHKPGKVMPPRPTLALPVDVEAVGFMPYVNHFAEYESATSSSSCTVPPL